MPRLTDVWANRLLGNWQLAPLVSMHRRLWFSPATGVDNSLTGIGLDRPNMNGDPYVRNTNTLQWLNPAGHALIVRTIVALPSRGLRGEPGGDVRECGGLLARGSGAV